jgi:iron complex outermembrane receptor protein
MFERRERGPSAWLSLTTLPLLFAATTAFADEAQSTSDEALSEITVFGRGESRQVGVVTALEMQQAAPGISPLKLVAELPGVSFQSADPYGAYEWSTRISVRGFSQNQLGFTLDGVPLGDMSYGNHNGLHISRAISAENISSSVLSQGAGALETASSSNLGGTLQFYSVDPSREAGINFAVTGGDYAERRAFVRLESGELGSFGTRAYLSYTNQKSDKWKGYGQQKQEQINFKVVQPVGEGKLTGFYNYSDRAENDYQDLSLGMINRLGYGWDNISNNWPLMVQVAQIYQAGGTNYPAPITTVDDAYANASGLRKDKLAGVTLNLPLAHDLTWDTTTYLHKNDGQGVWFTPYVPTPVGAPDGFGGTITSPAPISVRTTEYTIDRKGVTTALTWQLGQHKISGGFWYENNDFNQARRFYGLQLAAPQRDSLQFMRDPFYTQWQYAFNTKTRDFFVQDLWALTDALKLNYGFKSLDVKNQANAIVDRRFTNNLSGEIEAKKNFLPQVGFNYSLDRASEVFGDVTRNMRAFIAAAAGPSPFATSPTNFALLKQNGLKPETSTTYELGWRYNVAELQAVATVYYVDFKDRLLANTIGAGIVGNPVVLQNVGAVQTKGAELGARWAFATHWSWYNSLSINDSKYKDNVVSYQVVNGATVKTVVPTSGKTVVDAPKTLFKSQFGYDDGSFFAKLGLDYTGKRYFTYTNDLLTAGDGNGNVASYTIFDLGVGYRLTKGLGFVKSLGVQANVENLTDKRYISTIGSNGFTNMGDNQTFMVGFPRQWFVSVNGQF